jgi:hypothetical protein
MRSVKMRKFVSNGLKAGAAVALTAVGFGAGERLIQIEPPVTHDAVSTIVENTLYTAELAGLIVSTVVASGGVIKRKPHTEPN